MVRRPDGIDDLLDRINGILGKVAARPFLFRKANQVSLCEGRQFGGRATAQERLWQTKQAIDCQDPGNPGHIEADAELRTGPVYAR